jgi:trimeric autotransporter adhesin
MNRFESVTKPLRWFMALLLVAIVAGCGSSNGSSADLRSLVSVTVTPATTSIPISGIKQFVATATYSDGSSSVVTTSSSWASGTTSKATVNSTSGVATGVASGTSVITATFGGMVGSATLTVTTATLTSIAVTPATASIAISGTKQFVATATYSDLTTSVVTASWTSGTPGVATVNHTSGVATGVASGTSVITATFGGKTATATLTVTGAVATNPTAPVLGEAGRYVILASQKVTTTTGSAISNGDIGNMDQARATYITGFTPDPLNPGNFAELTNGYSYAMDDVCPHSSASTFDCPLHYSTPVVGAAWTDAATMITQVRTDLHIAYDFLAADPNPGAPTQACPTELGGLTLTRGVYKTALNVGITTGDLHLDAQGDPNSVFIFSIDGTLTTGAPGGSISLDNGALAKNVYWRVAGVTAIGPGTLFKGNVFAWQQVNVLAGADVTGRLFSVNEQVTLISDTVTKAP